MEPPPLGATSLSKMANLSGSYSNLYRESASGKLSLATTPADGDKSMQNVDEIMMVSSISGHENWQFRRQGNVSWPNPAQCFQWKQFHHQQQQQQLPSSNSVGKSNFSAVAAVDELNASFITSDLDLDLDDPVMSSSFASNSAKSTAQSVAAAASNNLLDSVVVPPTIAHLPPLKSSQPITAIEMKNVIKTLDPNVIIQSSPTTTTTTTNGTSSNSNNGTTNNSFLTGSSRLRLLQESTMIDTALDLDSLDGSIGNNSQSCLVKTAIV
ncbi:uncharacterized protein LOC119769191 [Culex quinquefasciatus]|uniref:uncharacterized protein LOC119769191 n=1 Tax=Culex quinquefasciatus TaxID=7176 RepID=UPI0018E30DC7|nr:uncharacterized protein LOC119769191 [Culex quinquefasciatus]